MERGGKATRRGGNNSKRYEPYARPSMRDERRKCESESNSDDEEFDRRGCIKVSSRSNVKSVAGKIAHSVRERRTPTILSIGNSCMNQAVKAAAIARKYLSQDGIDICIQPKLREGRKNAVALHVRRQRGPHKAFHPKAELTVSSSSSHFTVAGALAARIREDKRPCLTGIGVDAVAKGLLAICMARRYLEDQPIEIEMAPEFIHVQKEGQEMSAMRFNVLVHEF